MFAVRSVRSMRPLRAIRSFCAIRTVHVPDSFSARHLCGLFLCGSLGGFFAAVLIAWGLGNGSALPRPSPQHGEMADPAVLAALEWKQRRATFPMQVNDDVERWVGYFANNRKSVFEYALSRGGLYSDMIRTGLRERGMPDELLYLALIESDFHTDARSRVLATGMWQFMEPTAKRYGLRIDAYVDDRYDPVKATDAALDHLSDLYQQYGSWYLAAAAYNAGAIRVSDALGRYANGRTQDDNLYWEISDHLPSETANYVPKLLAAAHVAQSAAHYDLDVTPADPYRYDEVWSPGGVDLGGVANALGLAAEQLYDLNPQLIRRATPPGEVYRLRVPVGMAAQVVAALAVPDNGTRLADD